MTHYDGGREDALHAIKKHTVSIKIILIKSTAGSQIIIQDFFLNLLQDIINSRIMQDD